MLVILVIGLISQSMFMSILELLLVINCIENVLLKFNINKLTSNHF